MSAINNAGAASPQDAAEVRAGVIAALFVYGFWGVLPLIFNLLHEVSAFTVVADRTVWSLLLVGGVLLATGRMGDVRRALRDPQTLRSMLISAALLACNWLIYVYSIVSGQVLEASFGYFINPICNVAIAMLLLGERQNRMQTLAIALAVLGIAIAAIGVGGVPYIALGLALTFAFYGYFRKTAKVDSATGLFVETLVLVPVALGYLAFTFMTQGPGPHADPFLLTILILTGPATALPLLAFAFAVKRLRFTTIGMFQYIAPSIVFVLGITFFGEHLTPVRLVSFVIIWISLAIYTADSFRQRHRKAA